MIPQIVRMPELGANLRAAVKPELDALLEAVTKNNTPMSSQLDCVTNDAYHAGQPGEMKVSKVDRVLYGTKDPMHPIGEITPPALTSLLYRVCDRDQKKFEEACRIVQLFIEEALRVAVKPELDALLEAASREP